MKGARCSSCDEEIPLDAKQFVETIGWVDTRKPGSRLRLRRQTKRVACEACVSARERGVDRRTQQNLL